MSLKVETIFCSEKKLGTRTILLVGHANTWRPKGLDYVAVWAEPFAALVVEAEMEYVVALTAEPIALEQILEELPSLKEMIQRAKARARSETEVLAQS